jgi:hypothetical protein
VSSVYEPEIEDGVFEDVEAHCVALVPVIPTFYEPPRLVLTRPNASFVAQLIATAQHLPQTCNLRRAAPADVLSAYSTQQRRLLQRAETAAHPANLEKAA